MVLPIEHRDGDEHASTNARVHYPRGDARRQISTLVKKDIARDINKLIFDFSIPTEIRSARPWLNVIKLEGIKVFIERCRKADKVVIS